MVLDFDQFLTFLATTLKFIHFSIFQDYTIARYVIGHDVIGHLAVGTDNSWVGPSDVENGLAILH